MRCGFTIGRRRRVRLALEPGTGRLSASLDTSANTLNTPDIVRIANLHCRDTMAWESGSPAMAAVLSCGAQPERCPPITLCHLAQIRESPCFLCQPSLFFGDTRTQTSVFIPCPLDPPTFHRVSPFPPPPNLPESPVRGGNVKQAHCSLAPSDVGPLSIGRTHCVEHGTKGPRIQGCPVWGRRREYAGTTRFDACGT